MSVDALQAAILNEASEQASGITQTGNRELAHLKESLQQKMAQLEEQIVSEAETRGVREARALKQAALLEAKADILKAKQEELELTQRAAIEAVLAWDENSTTLLLKALFNQLSDTDGEVVPGSHHKDAVAALAKDRGMKVAGETLEDEGGFVVRYDYGEVDMRLSRMVEHVFARHLAVIARHLFNGTTT